MSIFFFDGFDFTNGNDYGPAGRLWDQGSAGNNQGAGEWGGYCVAATGSGNGFVDQWKGMFKNFALAEGPSGNRAGVIMGCAALFNTFTADYGGVSFPFIYFGDTQGGVETAQCSLWINPNTGFTMELRAGLGQQLPSPTILATSSFVPPLTLWFYLEVKLTIGSPGSVEVRINGTPIITASGITTQQSSNPTWNTFHLTGMGNFGPEWITDDLYLIDPNDGTDSIDFLGEVRVQTLFPDADGYETDFLRSTGSVNAFNVNQVTNYPTEPINFNFNGTVGAIDLYDISPFSISGTIFAVQENMSVSKDDTGSRDICPLLRTASVNYQGPTYVCYSSYTYAGNIWELNPETNAQWTLTELNTAQFGIEVIS